MLFDLIFDASKVQLNPSPVDGRVTFTTQSKTTHPI